MKHTQSTHEAPTYLAGVKARSVHPCRVAGNTV